MIDLRRLEAWALPSRSRRRDFQYASTNETSSSRRLVDPPPDNEKSERAIETREHHLEAARRRSIYALMITLSGARTSLGPSARSPSPRLSQMLPGSDPRCGKHI
jgi:hypothetical protein